MRYRDRLTIQQLTRTTDPQTRQRVETWTTFHTIRGTIEGASASDRIINEANRDTLIAHTIKIPSNSITRQIKPAMRIVAGGVSYNIEAATDPQERRREIKLQVTMVVNAR